MADDGNNAKKSGGGVFGSLVQAESMIQLALALPAGCLIGWFLGMLLDHHFHTEWMEIVGILLGAVAGFVQIFTTASRVMKKGS
jgi:F0F1-type ATP synthase assembly protein I